MENEMIERVARAIADANMEDYDELKELHDALARAAIAAMREPTEAMEREYFNALTGNRREVGRKVYRAMIDAALKSE